MRIDFHYDPQPASQAEPNRAQTARNGERVPPSLAAADQAQLSGAHIQVQALAGQAAQLPDIRAERVQSLREALASGHYRFEAHKTAGAIVSHMLVQARR